MLKLENVSEERSVISTEVVVLCSAISLDNSLEVYDDKSVISLETSVCTALISVDVSLDRSEISVLRVLNTNEDKSSNSLPFSSRRVLTSLDNSLAV